MKPLAPRRVALSLAVLPLDVARNVHEERDGKQEGLNDVGPVLRYGVLGCPWDLITTYNWAYNPTYNPLNGPIGVTPLISRVIIPVISSY